MDTLACIQAWLIWQEHNEQPEVPDIPLSSITGLVILIVILTSPFNLHPALAAELLARGSRGQEVVKLQDDLKEAGCFPEGVRSTGYYGKTTKSAVTQLQKTHALRVDGVVGEQTRSALNSGKTCQSSATSGTLKMGSRGKNVSQLQIQLNNWGFPVQKIDGIFGKETRGSVIRFQESKGLKPDGIVGPKMAQILWIPQTLIYQANTGHVFSDTDPYEQAFRESIFESNGQIEVFLTYKNFKVIISAVLDENLEKKTRYQAALFLAQRIYKDNLDKNGAISTEYPKPCKSPSFLDYPEVYINDSLLIAGTPQEVPIDKIRFILKEAVEQEEYLFYRFLAASAMPYIRETPTKNIINILKEELETEKLSKILNSGANQIRNLNHEHPNNEKICENSYIIKQSFDSLEIFSEYANTSSYFEDIIPVLAKVWINSNNIHSSTARIILENIAEIGNNPVFPYIPTYPDIPCLEDPPVMAPPVMAPPYAIFCWLVPC